MDGYGRSVPRTRSTPFRSILRGTEPSESPTMPLPLEKVLGTLAMPLTVLPLLALLFLLLLARHSRQPLLAFLAALPLLALWALATPLFAGALLADEEARWTELDPQSTAAPGVVVVLGGGTAPRPGRSAFDQLTAASLQRTLEGVRLARAWPDAVLLFSGDDGRSAPSAAERMAEVARALGVDPERIELDRESRNTAAQARTLGPRLADGPVVLVTSALHMRRALALFRARGLDPVPAPTDFLDLEPSPYGPRAWLPDARVLARVTALAHERLGLLWARLRGQLAADAPAGP